MLLINGFSGIAQEINSALHLESIDSNGMKKEIKGQCVHMSFVSLKNNYVIVIVPLEFLADATELKVFLKQESKTEDFVVALSIDQIYLAKSKKLAAFPFFVIREKLQNVTGIINPTLVMEEILKIHFPEVPIEITENDITELHKVMEKQLAE